ncbi:MAG: hypothetical protein O2910_06285 [Proteobacteria bacterium]|nr:hypothetical protein [Pseudomonadota bacterium]
MTSIAADKGIPENLLDRPSRDEFDDLQERYDRLLRAYREMERDQREASNR